MFCPARIDVFPLFYGKQDSPTADQCVFIRGFQVKRSLFRIKPIRIGSDRVDEDRQPYRIVSEEQKDRLRNTFDPLVLGSSSSSLSSSSTLATVVSPGHENSQRNRDGGLFTRGSRLSLDEPPISINPRLSLYRHPTQTGFPSPSGGIQPLVPQQLLGDLFLQQNFQQHNQEVKGTTTPRIPWTLSEVEKKCYDQIFEAWDASGSGFIDGKTAIQVFGQSGLDWCDLEKIW